ncbi:ferrochelatase [Planctomicrobium sp. SH668]|uniref:ferrochelatase n=1 Tax=Planctomicrobium sp. SH668 TaxID=3448126 RepID=UPI003F5B8EEC
MNSVTQNNYDAILFVSFGGPECREDVIPFLENVLRGRNVPRERMLAVAEHYYHFDGVSPINQQNRDLIAAVQKKLPEFGIHLPIYWGNRNWHPLLPETLQRMADDDVQYALAFVTAAHSSYSSCRQYRQNIEDACQQVGSAAPQVDKIRVFYNHPDFIAASVDRAKQAIQQLSAIDQANYRIAFTAHSIPTSMANSSAYEKQLRESCRLVADALELPRDRWELVYQSRSGRPEDPWLEPDVLDHLKQLKEEGTSAVVVLPIGFISDHMEVLFDLDIEAKDLCEEIGLNFQRAGTVGVHPKFVEMICKLIAERVADADRDAIGEYEANWDVCPQNCCPAPQRR